jgi:DNA-binding beta-propeller fold protein YncE
MRRMRLAALALCASLAALALPGQALGAANHPFLSAINGGYEDACGVGFGPGGLYVSDYYHDSIVGPTTIAAESPGDGPCKLGFDAAGDLYVNNWHRDVVKYTEPFTVATGAVVDSAQPTGLAVDQVTGDVYVAHRTYVAEYSSTGAPIATIGVGQLSEGYGVAVSEFPATAGDLYVPDAKDNTVKVFDPAGALIGEMDGAATPQGHFTYLTDSEVAVDNSPTSPSYGHVFVLDAIGHGLSEQPKAALDEFNAAGAYRGQIEGFTDAEPSGIAFQEGTHNVYVTNGNTEGSAVFVYGPTAAAHSLKVAKSGTGGGTVTSSPAGIACGSACTAEFDEGKTVTLFAAPDAHSVFAGWTVTGAEPCPGTGSCTVLISHNVEVSASFEEPANQQTLTLSESGGGAGTVISEPAGISCPSDCAEHFNEGRLVTLTATPAPHNRFAGWAGVACDESTLMTCQVTMNQAESLSAQFAPIPQITLTVTKTGSGQGTVTSAPAGISCPGACSAAFDQGSALTLTAAPAPNATFAGYSGAGCSQAATCTLTISAAESLSAEFASSPQPSSPPSAPSAAPPTSQSVATTPAVTQASGPQKRHRKHKKHRHRRKPKHHAKHRAR